MPFLPGVSGLIRVAMLAALGLLLLVAGCSSARVQTAEEAKGWERCDRSRPASLTFLCFQR